SSGQAVHEVLWPRFISPTLLWSISDNGGTLSYRLSASPPVHCMAVNSERELCTLRDLSSDAVLSADGRMVAVRKNGAIRVIDIVSGREISALDPPGVAVAPLAFSHER